MNLLKESIQDLTDDFDELTYLYKSAIKNLGQFQNTLKAKKKHILNESYETLYPKAEEYCSLYQDQIDEIKILNNRLDAVTDLQELAFFAEQKTLQTRFLREHIGLSSSLIVSTDWQSPSFMHSLHSEAGRQSGEIIGTINDYKRDRHLDENSYKSIFIKQYVQGLRKALIYPYMVSSGMAAFATILAYLLLEKKTSRPILLGKNSWFENKELIKKSWDDCIEVSEEDTPSIIQVIKDKRPEIVFFDSLCNASSITMPDLEEIIHTAAKYAKDETFIVIDNSCLATFLQPLQFLPKISKVRLIVFESLNKYHQYGLDRVTGGIIWSLGGDTWKLFTYRARLGTNIPDSYVYALPTPHQGLLKKRMLRHNRNALYLAQSLQDYVETHDTKIESINYPGLPNHPSYKWAKKYEFTGSFFSLSFKKKYREVDTYNRFVKLSIDRARKNDIQLVSGTSFGLNTTRIYLTALRASIYGDPFIRISAGTEHRMDVERLKEVFVEAIRRL